MGDKAAVTYLLARDPGFLEAYQRFISATDDQMHKFELYKDVASIATAPLGGLWPLHTSAMNIDHALETWQLLVSGKK